MALKILVWETWRRCHVDAELGMGLERDGVTKTEASGRLSVKALLRWPENFCCSLDLGCFSQLN